MNAAISDSEAERNFKANYVTLFGGTEPQVRKLESGGYSVKFPDGKYQRYSKRGLRLYGGLYLDMAMEN